MVNFDIGNASVGDTRPTNIDFKVPAVNTDGISSQKETVWFNNKWSEYFGHFLENPHLKNAILLRATWNVGKGYSSDAETSVILDHITGWGKDTFLDILYNMDITMSIGGDAYAEIIRDSDTGELLNLKPLNPQSIAHVLNGQGQIIRYEQHSRLGETTAIQKFKPEEILHFCLDRVADQIHGTSLIPSLKNVLNAWGEVFEDLKQVMHRQAKPLIIFKLKTDNVTKIEQFKSKMQEAMRKATDNIIFVPDDENVLSYEVVQINPSPLLLEQKNSIRKDFYSTIGSPELLSDSSGSTESGGKIGYLTFEQLVEKRQSYIEGQIWNQLNLRIELTQPASLAQNLIGDESKDGAQSRLNFQPNETQAGVGA